MNLSTDYLGMTLKNPIVASASPLSRTLDGVRELEDAGASAVVLYSLFAEQVALAQHPSASGAGKNNLALSYFPRWERDPVGPDAYLDHVSLAKRAVGIPIIGSLNGASPGDWTRYARLIEDAGADALELNLYYIATDPHQSGEAVEQMYLDVVREVSRSVTIPVAVKLSPFFSALPYMARRFVEAGADALVLFNRFYQPDIDLERRRTELHLTLSDSGDLRLPLRWIALLYGDIPIDLALTSGVHTHEDALKAMYAGANVAMMASELLQNGVGRIRAVLQDMDRWMEAHGVDSVARMRGQVSQFSALDAAAFERGRYAQALQDAPPGLPLRDS